MLRVQETNEVPVELKTGGLKPILEESLSPRRGTLNQTNAGSNKAGFKQRVSQEAAPGTSVQTAPTAKLTIAAVTALFQSLHYNDLTGQPHPENVEANSPTTSPPAQVYPT
jgi:hypothetical protein